MAQIYSNFELVKRLEELCAYSRGRPLDIAREFRSDVEFSLTEEDQFVFVENLTTRFRHVFVKIPGESNSYFKISNSVRNNNNGNRKF